MSDEWAQYSMLPDVQKRELCLELLEEFGADGYTETPKGELQHRCTLPFGGHTDHNSLTASVNFKKLVFSCLVCGNKGSLMWWIAVNRRTSTTEAKGWLQSKAGSEGLDLQMMHQILDQLAHAKQELKVPMPTYSERILAPWTSWPIHHPYLTLPTSEGGREIPPATLDKFKVGYCDEDPGWGYHQRIIIPLFWEGNLVGWQARKLSPTDPRKQKYINSPEVPRAQILYGDIDAVGDTVVVVESPMSVLRHWHHLPVLSTLGATVSDRQATLLHGFKKVVLWFDADQAGRTAVQGTRTSPGLFERLRKYTDVWVVDSPYAKADPADFSDEEVDKLVVDAIPFPVWEPRPLDKLLTYERK